MVRLVATMVVLTIMREVPSQTATPGSAVATRALAATEHADQGAPSYQVRVVSVAASGGTAIRGGGEAVLGQTAAGIAINRDYNLFLGTAVLAAAGPNRVVSDTDGDLDADLRDFAVYQRCMSGDQRPSALMGCPISLRDPDNDVDLKDFALFALRFTGPSQP